MFDTIILIEELIFRSIRRIILESGKINSHFMINLIVINTIRNRLIIFFHRFNINDGYILIIINQ